MLGWLQALWSRIQTPPQTLGNQGEAQAARFLEGLGYKILQRQLRGRFGELDLVAIDGSVIVFIEVKTRSSTAAGHPTESITPGKQRKITQSALAYLKYYRWLNRPARFDVISIIWPASGNSPEITHYINAFEPTGFGQMYS